MWDHFSADGPNKDRLGRECSTNRVLKTREGDTSMSQNNIGYMRLVEKSPYRIWEVRDKDGKLLERGDCIGCTITAARYDMRVLTVH